MPQFTPTESRILDKLSDGERHTPEELARVIDEYAEVGTVRVHLVSIRKKLNGIGQHIVSEWTGKDYMYRHVRLLHSVG